MSGPFKMKGSSFYGHGNSSPAKSMPSYIDGVQVSDFEADEQERENQANPSKNQPKVTRTGGSEAKNILKNLSEKERMSGKKDKITQDLLAEAREEQADPENYEAEKEQVKLNKENEKKRRKEGTLKNV